MDLSDSASAVNVIAGIVILLGVVGVFLPVLPGLLLSWAGVLLWAVLDRSALHWGVLGAATLVAVVGAVIKWFLPSRRLRRMGVPASALFAGGLIGLVGFFVIPVLGLPLGFVLGVWLVQRVRVGPSRAWASTKEALTAAGLSMLIEFAAALGVAVVWIFGVAAS